FSKELGRRSLAEYVQAEPQKWAQWPQHVQSLRSLQRSGGGAAAIMGPYRSGDNSNTQFATLALWSARRQNLPVERALDLIVIRLRKSQNPDGSWSYSGHSMQNHLPTMTGAGLLGMAVGYGLLPPNVKLDPFKDPAIQNGLAHLGKSVEAPSTE